MNFQDLCEVENEDNIVLKDSVQKADMKSNDDVINNFLGTVFYKKHNAINENPDLKDYQLASLELGTTLFNLVGKYFNIPYDKGIYRVFDVLVIETDAIKPYDVIYNYSWTAFEMGGK